MNPTNKKLNVLVTGASGGIGGAIATRFYREGYNVALHYSKNREKTEELKKRLEKSEGEIKSKGVLEIFRADFEDENSVHCMFSEIENKMGNIDVLINNAGCGTQVLFSDISYELWRKTFSVNVDAAFLCTKEALPGMIHEKFGKIVNISSIWGICGASCEVHYSATKAALIGFTKALAQEVGPSGIAVNCVAPGVIDTQMNAHLSEEDMNVLKDQIPMERIGTPEDIAGVVYFLCSKDAGYITGQIISPNGGMVL